MQPLYDLDAPKKPTNLSLNSDLLKRSRALNINLSATLEQALKAKLAESQAEKWKSENKNAIQAYNEFVEEHGCFSDEFREFFNESI
ncbi:MAG: type II toxin-antitoxin system CcdA family antitoxin [Thiotrichales bacterium]